VAVYFHNLGKRLPLRAFTEQRLRVTAGEPHRYRIPDVCVVRKPYRREPVLTEPPLIVIEILSSDDTMNSIMDRLGDFQRFGVPHIWVVDPLGRRVYAFERRQDENALREVGRRKIPLTELGLEVDFNEIFVELDSD
jgi:Uma2 family endonuclease